MKKIKPKIIGRTIAWIILGFYLVLLPGFTARESGESLCQSINVVISDSAVNSFVSASQVKKMLLDENDRLLGYPLNEINTRETEKILKKLPFTRAVNVFKTVEGTLHVEIQQRVPIVKVYNMKNESYYIDIEGYILPASDQYSANVLIANGYVKHSFNNHTAIHLLKTPLEKNNLIYDIYTLAKYIDAHPFWKNQFEQLYVTRKNQFELIPRVGAHIILMGSAEDHEYKLRKLKSLYKGAFSKIGWNEYEYINLKYKDQIICTKR